MKPEDILVRAVEIDDTAQRAEYLSKACGDDDRLRAYIEKLLEIHKMFQELPPDWYYPAPHRNGKQDR